MKKKNIDAVLKDWIWASEWCSFPEHYILWTDGLIFLQKRFSIATLNTLDINGIRLTRLGVKRYGFSASFFIILTVTWGKLASETEGIWEGVHGRTLEDH